MAELYITSTGESIFDEIDSVYNYVNDTSNELIANDIYNSNQLVNLIYNTSNNNINFTLNTSNNLANFIINTSNNLANFIVDTSIIIILPDEYTNKIPATLYYDAPPLHEKLPCPKSNFFNNDFLIMENVSFTDRFAEITSTKKNIHDYITKIIDILIEHEYNFSLNSVSATEWEKYNAILSLNRDERMKLIEGWLLTLTGAEAFTLSRSLDSALSQLLTKTDPNNSNKTLSLNLLDDDIFYIFSYGTANNTITSNFGSTVFNGKLYNPNNQITSISSPHFEKSYNYINSTPNNYISVLENDGDKIVSNLLRWINNFTISINIKLTTYSLISFIKAYDDNYTYLEAGYNVDGNIFFTLNDYNGNFLLYVIYPYNLYINTWYNITIVYSLNSYIKIYINNILQNTSSNSVYHTWENIDYNNNLKLQILNNSKNINVEYFRLIPRAITSTEVKKIYDIYSSILSLNEIDANQSNYVLNTSNIISNRLTNTSNVISNRISLLDGYTSNYIKTNSNELIDYVILQKGLLQETINLNDTNVSNYILHTSNTISNKISILDNNQSNYILNTTNEISNRITQQFLDLNNEINSAWNSNSSTGVVYNLDDKIGIGTYTIDDNTKLKIVGNTDIEGNLNIYDGGFFVNHNNSNITPVYSSIQNFLDNYGIIDRFYVVKHNGLYDYKNNEVYNPQSDQINIIYSNDLGKYVSRMYNNPKSGFFQPHDLGGFASNRWAIAMNIKFNDTLKEFTICNIYNVSALYATIRAKADFKLNRIVLYLYTTKTLGQPMELQHSAYIKVNDAKAQHFYVFNIYGYQYSFYVDGVNVFTIYDAQIVLGIYTKVWVGNDNGSYIGSYDYSDVIICDGHNIEPISAIIDIMTYINTLPQKPDNMIYGKTYIEYIVNEQLRLGEYNLVVSSTTTNTNRKMLQIDNDLVENDVQIINSVNNMINNTNSSGFLRYADNNIESSPSLIQQIDYNNDIANKPTIPSTTTQIAEGTNLYYTAERVNVIANAYNLDTSNYVLNTSNNLINYDNNKDLYTSNYILITSNNLINYTNNKDLNTSNYILNTSNNLINYANNKDINVSNYVLNTSNNLINYTNTKDLNNSNYILNTSNNLINYTNNKDLNVSNNLINYTNTKDLNVSNYILNTSNNLINYANNKDINVSNYVLNTSNNLINYTNTKDLNVSNNLINYTNTKDLNVSNYILNTSNNLINYANNKDLNISNYVLNTSYWNENNLALYTTKHVMVGTSGGALAETEISKLYVNGDIKALSGISLTQGCDSNILSERQITFSFYQTDYYTHSIRTRHRGIADNQNAIDFYLWDNSRAYYATGNRHKMSITAGGVGIGKTTPTEELDIIGNVNITGDYKINGSSLGNNISNYVLNTSNVISNRITDTSNIISNRITDTSNVISNRITNTSNYILNTSNAISNRISSLGSSAWTVNGTSIYYNNGNVGIGTTNPREKLEIANGYIITRGQWESSSTGIYFGTLSNPVEALKTAIIAEGINSWCRAKLHFCLDDNLNNTAPTYNASVSNSRMTILSGGNVGINTTNPRAKLEVADGNIIVRQGEGGSAILYLGTTNNASSALKTAIIAEGINSWSRAKLHFCLDNTGDNTYPTFNASVSNSRMTITNTGYVGIGLTNPDTFLHVANGSYSVSGIFQSFIGSGGVASAFTGSIANISAVFEGTIWCKNKVVTSSDIRIKKNIQDINDDSALQKILAIEPKTYNYIDEVDRGSNLVYGFIAQQIREVIPEAVQFEKNLVPNIYKLCDCSSNIIYLDNTSNLNINDKIDIITENDERKQYTIDNIGSNYFVIDSNINYDKAFVYGTEVKDFHALDKSYIYTLNVCATQELNRKIQDLTNRIIYLENYISSNL